MTAFTSCLPVTCVSPKLYGTAEVGALDGQSHIYPSGFQWAWTVGNESLLRFITCGSVDDGKSTLIGRLLHDSRAVPDDQLATQDWAAARWAHVRQEAAGQGTGLGLSLAQNFVSQHHGIIECDSGPGRTCFTVLLPVRESQHLSAPPLPH
mgnify:CR=1 FL=1